MITGMRTLAEFPLRRLMFTALGLLTMAALLSCAQPKAVPPEQAITGKKRPVIHADALAQRVHRLINSERAKRDLPPLSWDNDLARIARDHSRDMALRKYFSHDSPEGRDFSYRYRQEGYTCAVRTGSMIYTGAENIFQNNLYDSVITVNGKAYYDWNSEERIAETTVRGWMISPGHRKNILIPHWRNEGIGIFIAPDDSVYITQNFC